MVRPLREDFFSMPLPDISASIMYSERLGKDSAVQKDSMLPIAAVLMYRELCGRGASSAASDRRVLSLSR